MKIGTRSLLFGIHQFIYHPIVVYKAWCYLYCKRPSWKELVCIIIHDWGYWGKPNLDGPEGLLHPLLGSLIAYKLFGSKYCDLCSGHSRSYVKFKNEQWGMSHGIDKYYASKLCWADKLSFCFEPGWFYIIRARLSGELKEIRELSARNGIIEETASNKEWQKAMYTYCKHQPEIINILSSSEWLLKNDPKI